MQLYKGFLIFPSINEAHKAIVTQVWRSVKDYLAATSQQRRCEYSLTSCEWLLPVTVKLIAKVPLVTKCIFFDWLGKIPGIS